MVDKSHPMKANFSRIDGLIAQTKQTVLCLKPSRIHIKTGVLDCFPFEVLEKILNFVKPYSAALYVNKTWSSISYKNSWRNVTIHDSTTAKRLLFILGIKSNHRYRLSHPDWPTLPCPSYVDFLVRMLDDHAAQVFLLRGSKLLDTSCIKSFSMAPENPHGTFFFNLDFRIESGDPSVTDAMCDFLSRLPRLEHFYISNIPLLDWSPVPYRSVPFNIFQNLSTLKIASDLIAVPSFFDQLEPCRKLSSLFLDIDPSFFLYSSEPFQMSSDLEQRSTQIRLKFWTMQCTGLYQCIQSWKHCI